MQIKNVIPIGLLLLLILISSCNKTNIVDHKSSTNKFENFITVDGNQLKDGNNIFRFISFNVPTLHYNEDEFGFDRLYAYSLPNEFELRDIFESVSQMGGKVIRMYTIPVKIESESDQPPTYVLAPNKFSEKAFQSLDLALALAEEYQVRIIFSLLNNWQWMGGRPQYASFRGKTAEDFWTDRQLIDDFKSTINYTINRTNTITGVKYKDDKSILCWETGNELTCPLDWTIEICRYIKSIDQNHLLMDGYHASDKRPIREGSITEKSIDIIHSHHYEVNPAEFIENVNRNIAIMNGRKPYLIGEFGFVSTSAVEQYINKIMDSDVVGMLIWGLRGHRSDGGFYWHSEPLGFGRYKSYHWPGFDSGSEYDETNLMTLMRKKAYEIDRLTPPQLTAPKSPELLPIEHVGKINWRGSTGASSYDLYRSETENGKFELIAFNLSDASNQYFPFFNDETVEMGKEYFYQLVAKNKSGESKPSATVGPVLVKSKALVDDMENFGRMYFCTHGFTLETTDDRKFKEDMYRLKGNIGDEIIYFVPGNVTGFTVYSFCLEDSENLSFEISNDTENFRGINAKQASYNNGKGDYGYWVPISYTFNEPINAHYLKIKINKETQLSRLELFYK